MILINVKNKTGGFNLTTNLKDANSDVTGKD